MKIPDDWRPIDTVRALCEMYRDKCIAMANEQSALMRHGMYDSLSFFITWMPLQPGHPTPEEMQNHWMYVYNKVRQFRKEQILGKTL